MVRAYYASSASNFPLENPDAVIGRLVGQSQYEITPAQLHAWRWEIAFLLELAHQVPDAHFFLEFSIPRMGRRADAVILWRGVVFVIEFKVGAADFSQHAIDQVLGYALDLKNFHETSHLRSIVPVLVATEARSPNLLRAWYPDQVAVPVKATPAMVFDVLRAFTTEDVTPFDPTDWEGGRYRPTPTIIEAAQALYRNHTVEDISRSEAGATNLSTTAAYIGQVIDRAKAEGRKAICLVTGVPGSGKTLAGLNVANERMQGHDDEHAVFLSGNGPLVAVLREALTRDAIERAKEQGLPTSRAGELTRASAFIQNIHHFRDEALQTTSPMVGKVVVFDEAQRAWNVEQTSKFMREKRGQAGFSQSEPDFLLGVMDRNQDWCVVICLVGGGQEINTGEAGLPEWLQALSTRYLDWEVHLPVQVLGHEYVPPDARDLAACRRAISAPELHLSISIRSFRAEKLSQFIAAVIESNPQRARELLAELSLYPIVITRDLQTARLWIRRHRRGEERAGLLASSNGLRLKPEGVFVRAKVDPADWFLGARGDVRSSDYLEDAATEFEVQGLELDWACVCWDANLRRGASGWEPLRFRGTDWQRVNDADRKAFILNSYRVLLTRARQGMVVFVPQGDPQDTTRAPEIYAAIAAFLGDCGLPTV
ncbi:MAG: DUF2075 domain-containing protein [Pseudomonadota bacterium]